MAQMTLRKVLVEMQGIVQPVVMDNLTKHSGILQTAAAQKANFDVWHKYKELSALPTFSVVQSTGGTTAQTVNREIKKIDLQLFEAHQSEPAKEAEVYPGGVQKLFQDDSPAWQEAWGQNTARQIIYGTNSTFGNKQGFEGLHQIAKAKSNIVAQLTGTTGSRTSIFAVKWNPNHCAILYNEALAQKNEMFLEIKVLNNGEAVLVVTNTTTGAKQYEYQAIYRGWLGFYSATNYDIAAITQVQDDTGKRPTVAQIDELVDAVKGSSTDTFIYCSRLGKRVIGQLKDTKLSASFADKNYDTRVSYWQDIPVVVDDNILDTETTALD
jgi:hypothetical protein